MSTTIEKPLSADRPLNDPKLDRFGYAPFARQLANSILMGSPADGLVIALLGGFGSVDVCNMLPPQSERQAVERRSYLLQAAIAAVHDEAARAEDTDWPQIVALYGELMRMSDNPMVALNHAVAVAMAQGPAEGLALLERLEHEARINDHYRLDAVRAHLLERSGDIVAALPYYAAAAARTSSLPERNYLLLKIARLRAS